MFILIHLDDEREAVIQTDAIISATDRRDGTHIALNTKDGVSVLTVRDSARSIFQTILGRSIEDALKARPE